MQEAAVFTPEEQKYFDTKGAEGPKDDGTPVAPAEPVEKPAPIAAEPVKEPEKAAEPEDKDNPGKFVRLAALHEEREKRREISRRFEEERIANAEFRARAEERLNFLARQSEPPPQPADPIQELQELKQWRQQTEAERQQQVQAQQQYQALASAVTQAEEAFAKTTPDYYDAITYAREARDRELQLFGVSNPHERNAILEDTITRVSAHALQRGESPAEMFYKYALERGFKAKPPEPPKTTTAADKLAKIAEGQNAGKSLGAAAGSATPQLTLESLANMSDDEFAKVALNKKEWRKLMGG